MDRTIVYPGAIPLDTDALAPQRYAEIALGWLTHAVFGNSTGFAGLGCNPTSPASMTVNIGPGALWTLGVVDSNAYGSLTADNSPLMRMGINASAAGTDIPLTAPGASGQSIAYLIQGSFSEADTDAIVLPYVNASNPSQSWAGPNNQGVSQNTRRSSTVSLTVKAGTPATTGSQAAPAPDAGKTGLYVVTVANGQTSITAGDISTYSASPYIGAPFNPFRLPDLNDQVLSVIKASLSTPDPANKSQLQESIARIAGLGAAGQTISGGNFSMGVNDIGRILVFNGSSAATATLLSANTSGLDYIGGVVVSNQGTAPLTVAPAAGDAINGASSLILPPGTAMGLRPAGGGVWIVVWSMGPSAGTSPISGGANASNTATSVSTSVSFTAQQNMTVRIDGSSGASGVSINSLSLSASGGTVEYVQSNLGGNGGVHNIGTLTAIVSVTAGSSVTLTLTSTAASSVLQTVGFNYLGFPTP